MTEPAGLRGPMGIGAPWVRGHPPIAMTQRDRDALMTTLAGEVGSEPRLAQQAVFGVILNRALMSGRSIYDIVTEQGRNHNGTISDAFGGYYDQLKRGPISQAEYDRIWRNIEPVASGIIPNPAGSGTHYYSPISMHPPGSVPYWARGRAALGDIGHERFYALPFAGRQPFSSDPAQPFGGAATNPVSQSSTVAKPPEPAPIARGASTNTTNAVSPHADLSSYLRDASYDPSATPVPAAGQPGLAPQPSAPDPVGQPQPQGALNAPPQGGLPTGLGDYLYGPGAPVHAGPAPLGALALNARPSSQGVLNGSPPVAAAANMGADITDPDALAFGPENAAILSRLLAKPPAQAIEPLKPTNVMLADALRALAPSDPSAGKALNGALSAPNPPALQTALAQGPLNPAGQAAQAQNPLVAALMAMRPGGSTAPAAAAYQQA